MTHPVENPYLTASWKHDATVWSTCFDELMALTAVLCWTGSMANCFAQREPAFPGTFINPQRNSSISLATHWNVRWLWWRPLLRSAAWLTVSAAIQLHIATLYPGTVEIAAHFRWTFGRVSMLRCWAKRSLGGVLAGKQCWLMLHINICVCPQRRRSPVILFF